MAGEASTSAPSQGSPSVLFLILPEGSSTPPERACCKEAVRAWREGRHVGLHTDSMEQARRMDTLLWTFSELDFLPHRLAPPQGRVSRLSQEQSQVESSPPQSREAFISWGDQTPPCDLLFNLAPYLPVLETPQAKVVEIVPGKEPERSRARKHWQRYKEQGLQLQSRKLREDIAP